MGGVQADRARLSAIQLYRGHGKKGRGIECVPSNHRRLYDAGALGLHSALGSLGSLGSAASLALCAALALDSASAFTWTNKSVAELD